MLTSHVIMLPVPRTQKALNSHSIVVLSVSIFVTTYVQLTWGGVGDGARQGPAFSRRDHLFDADGYKDGSTSLYHIVTSIEVVDCRRPQEERAAHHWAVAVAAA
jgi:hypothetical protein